MRTGSSKNRRIEPAKKPWDKVFLKLSFLRLDARSLSLFRIVFGLGLLWHLIYAKLPCARLFWGYDGIFAHKIITETVARSFSIFDLFSSDVAVVPIFVSAIAVVFLYTIGWHSRWTGALAYFFLWNIQQRTPPLGFGGDFYTLHILFLSLFLPLNNHFSIKQTDEGAPEILPSIAFLIQVLFVYFSSGWAKYGDSWVHGYAVRNMLLDRSNAYSWTHIVVDHPIVYTIFTYAAWLGELATPFLLLLPIRQPLLRAIPASFIVLFHLMTGAMYDVGVFWTTGFAAGVALMPAQVYRNWMATSFQATNKISNKWRGAFSLLFIYLIIINNLEFILRTEEKREGSAGSLIHDFVSFMSPAPFDNSFLFFQNWRMFAPDPSTNISWFAIEQEVAPGQWRDVLHDLPVDTAAQQPLHYYRGFEGTFLTFMRFWKVRPERSIYLKQWIVCRLLAQGDKELLYRKGTKLVEYECIIKGNESKYQTPVTRYTYSLKATE
ncbi:MAG: HTTM domain-containing protein [Chitinophagales bacterium]